MMMMEEEKTTPKSAKNTSSSSSSPKKEKKVALECPRCNSNNTKFCYYNNYSLKQPRYFCKACKRYWTHGGSLRSIPIGGRSRKINKRSSYSSRQLLPHLVDNQSVSNNNIYHMNCPPASAGVYNSVLTNPNPKYGQDLNLGFMASQNLLHLSNNSFLNDPYSYALDANNLVQLLTGIRAPFMGSPDNNPGYPVGLSLQSDPRTTLPGADGRVFFPSAIAAETVDDHDRHHQQVPTGYWSGNINLGGAGTW